MKIIYDNGIEIEKRDWEKQPLQVLSCGFGSQSAAMVFLSIDGLIPRPDIIIHSDTGSEMPYTLELIEHMKPIIQAEKIPLVIVADERYPLHESYKKTGRLPIVGFRSCTTRFKVEPCNQYIRKIVGDKNGVHLSTTWIGITTDELRRERKSKLKWNQLSYPLLNILRWSRERCDKYLSTKGMKVRKSSCFCCPYQGVKGFWNLKTEFPELFKECLEMEKQYFLTRPERRYGLLPNIRRLESMNQDGLEKWGVEIKCSPAGGCFL